MKNVYKYEIFSFYLGKSTYQEYQGTVCFFFLIISRFFENIGSHGTEDHKMQKCINKSEPGCMNFIKFLKERMDLYIIMRIYRHYTILLHIDQIEYILNNYTLKNL